MKIQTITKKFQLTTTLVEFSTPQTVEELRKKCHKIIPNIGNDITIDALHGSISIGKIVQNAYWPNHLTPNNEGFCSVIVYPDDRDERHTRCTVTRIEIVDGDKGTLKIIKD